MLISKKACIFVISKTITQTQTLKKMSELLVALINQDYSEAEAIEIISEMRERLYEGEDPEEILYEYGLEPDYIFDIL